MDHITFGTFVLTDHRKMCGQVIQTFWPKNILGVGCDYNEEQVLFGMMVWWESGVDL